MSARQQHNPVMYDLMQMLADWGRERVKLNELAQRSRPNVLHSLAGEKAEAVRRGLDHDGTMFASLIHGTGARNEPDYQPSEIFARIDYEVRQMPIDRARQAVVVEYDPRMASRTLRQRAAAANLAVLTYRIGLDEAHAYMLGRLRMADIERKIG